jgi:hypothetical protein
MTFEELWPSLGIPAEYDSMDSTDQACWRMVLRQAFEAGVISAAQEHSEWQRR